MNTDMAASMSPSSNPGHAAVILAAGGSRRLGQAKQLLPVDGRPLLARIIEQVAATAPAQLIVVLGADADRMRDALPDIARSSLQVLDNPDWQEGLASSLRLAAQTLAHWTGSTLIVGCDQPQLAVAHLQVLLARQQTEPSRDIATRYADVVGIPALVTAATLVQARDLSGDQGLRGMLRGAALAMDAPELAFDIDTPADLATAIARGWIDA